MNKNLASGLESLAFSHIHTSQPNIKSNELILQNLDLYKQILEMHGLNVMDPITYQTFQSQQNTISQLKKEKAELEQKLLQESRTDYLTNIPNKRYFSEKISEEFTSFQRYNTPLSLVLMDLNRFKDINDNYGHQAGDKVLKDFAKILKDNSRVGVDFPARVGGDEFAIILSNTNLKQAGYLIDRLMNEIEKTDFYYHNQKMPVSASMGIAQLNSHDSIETLTKRADKASYHAKGAGLNNVYYLNNIRKIPEPISHLLAA